MESESSFTRSVIDELHSWDIQGDEMEGENMVLLEVSLMNFILRLSKVLNWKVKVVLLEVPWMNVILKISNEMKWKVTSWCYSKYR